ncbi:MAG: RnfABCDGE type electron transport complex subunit B [Candidatus Cloacimonetes bacterium]|nr:RnfABCDGE type electron transport complex subunit B [Candidatus Cloacimonadota bacterium]
MILTTIIVLGCLGIIFGIVLAIASKKFHVEIDPKIEKIEEALPGANCGACGLPGCSGYAEAIVYSGADIHLCAPGGDEVAHEIAKIMGIKASKKERNIAVIQCQSGGINNTFLKFENKGIETCQAALILSSGHNLCEYGCLSYNDCLRACPFDAISLDDNNMRLIDEVKCTGCGNCVEACPIDLILLIPISKKVNVLCKSLDKGKDAKVKCGNKTACIGCGICAKKCPVEAITIENNLAIIDYEKCVACGICATVCPTKSIVDKIKEHPQPKIIEEKCNGCTICAKKCPVDAIEGELKKPHIIDEEKCIKCGICVEVCPKDAVGTG